MRLQNIANKFGTIYLSKREGKELKIETINSFFPYFFEPDTNGDYIGYDGTRLTKICCTAPHEVKNTRTPDSYEADVLYPKRYIIDNIPTIEKSETRWIAYDVEVDTKGTEFPDPFEAKYKVTIIRVYDNYTQERKTFDFRDYPSEYEMLEDFCNYIKERQPDLLLAWNEDGFDYPYLYNRIDDFPSKISPIGQTRMGKNGMFYPSLISIIDLLGLDHKYTLGKRDTYGLDAVLQEEFPEEKEWGETNWQDYDKVRAKCENDVERMIKLINKYDYINHFDDIRIQTTCLWEDIPSERRGHTWQSNNSKPIDMMFLREAKLANLVLPSKQDNEKEEYDGAYRQIFETGIFHNVGKYDLGSAYPIMISDFCLDPANLNEEKEGVKIDLISRDNKEIGTYYFKQNPNAILPTVVRKLLTMKNNLKEKLKADPNNKILEIRYDTIKALINSLYGVLGNRYFRLYDKRVAETDTFLVRDLLQFVKLRVEKAGYKVLYVDTDSFFVEGDKDISVLLNGFVLDWGLDKYNKKVNIRFEYEGNFKDIFLVKLCRYIGRLIKPTGEEKEEVKGLQMKRKDSSKFKKDFQKELLNYLMDGKEHPISFIEEQIDMIIERKPLYLGNPSKLSKPREDYKKKEIYFEALDNAKTEFDFQKRISEKFYWINIDHEEYNVIAFDEKTVDNINKFKLDYNKLIENNIFNVCVPIFIGLKKGKELLDLAEEYDIILKSDFRNQLLEQYENFEELKKYYSARVVKKRKKEKVNVK